MTLQLGFIILTSTLSLLLVVSVYFTRIFNYFLMTLGAQNYDCGCQHGGFEGSGAPPGTFWVPSSFLRRFGFHFGPHLGPLKSHLGSLFCVLSSESRFLSSVMVCIFVTSFSSHEVMKIPVSIKMAIKYLLIENINFPVSPNPRIC